MAAALFYGLEKILDDTAVMLAYVALVTTLLVRLPPTFKPTPLERALDLFD